MKNLRELSVVGISLTLFCHYKRENGMFLFSSSISGCYSIALSPPFILETVVALEDSSHNVDLGTLPYHLRARLLDSKDVQTSQQTQNICITFVHCWTDVKVFGPTLYTISTNVLCLLGCKLPGGYRYTCKLNDGHNYDL